MRTRHIALFLALLFAPSLANATDWYVDGVSGNDNNAGTSSTTPLLTPFRAVGRSSAGDTIHILPTTTYSFFGIYKSGTASKYITIIGDGGPKNLTKVNANGANFGIDIGSGASYINLLYFDVQAPGPWYAVHVGNNSHHVTIQGNTLHNAGHGGVGTTYADYLNILNNTIYNTSSNTSDGIFGSGISTYGNKDIDTFVGTKIVIQNNMIYNNTNTPTCGTTCYNNGLDTDGSGIIIDDARHTQSDNVAYKGYTLVMNNVVYNNGGMGIYVYNSDHVTIVNNTTYHNNQDTHQSVWQPGEIMVEKGGDTRVFNNAMYSDGASNTSAATGNHVCLSIEDSTDGMGPVSYDYNLFYNATKNQSLQFYQRNNTNLILTNNHNVWGDPIFASATTNPATANLQPRSSSPLFIYGTTSMAPSYDYLWASRPAAGPITIGAYQNAAGTGLLPPTDMRVSF